MRQKHRTVSIEFNERMCERMIAFMNLNAAIKHDEKTKAIIKEAFLKLYSQMPFEKISVKALAKEANISRGTFYLYYSNTEEMLDEIENGLIEVLRKKSDEYNIFRPEGFPQNLTHEILLQSEIQKEQIEIIMKGNKNQSFIKKFHNFHNNAIANNFNFRESENKSKAEYLKEYITSAHIGLLQYWIGSEKEDNPSEIIDLVNRITVHCIKSI